MFRSTGTPSGSSDGPPQQPRDGQEKRKLAPKTSEAKKFRKVMEEIVNSQFPHSMGTPDEKEMGNLLTAWVEWRRAEGQAVDQVLELAGALMKKEG